MNLDKLLEEFKAGNIGKEKVFNYLSNASFCDIGVANIDHDRKKRRGFGEVVYCKDKAPEDVRNILEHMLNKEKKVLATKANDEHFEHCKDLKVEYDKTSGLIYTNYDNAGEGKIVVISAGTSDRGIAEEASKTAEFLGSSVVRRYDYGVAGLNRLFSVIEELEAANAVIVVAGMDGALPSAVAGLISKPVIAVPTSVGYGASFEGMAALLTMLNSCSPGVSVVNIDNGFGAAYTANLINLQTEGKI